MKTSCMPITYLEVLLLLSTEKNDIKIYRLLQEVYKNSTSFLHAITHCRLAHSYIHHYNVLPT